ncbi:MAG: hypothetical protein ACLGIF_07410 [Actinomycetes bacterium]
MTAYHDPRVVAPEFQPPIGRTAFHEPVPTVPEPKGSKARRSHKPLILAALALVAGGVGGGAGAYLVQEQQVREVSTKLETARAGEVAAQNRATTAQSNADEARAQVEASRAEVREAEAAAESVESCRQALDLAEDVMTTAGDSMALVPEMLDAASSLDAEAMDEASADMRENTEKVKAITPDYRAARLACGS